MTHDLSDIVKLAKWPYFAYGSNLHLDQMIGRCNDAEPVDRAILRGYRLTFHRGVADVVPSPRSSVVGALYMVSTADIVALDRYEGYPRLYRRQTIALELPGDRVVRAFCYVMQTEHHQVTPPRHGYLEVIEQGFRDWNLPARKLDKAVRLAISTSGGR